MTGAAWSTTEQIDGFTFRVGKHGWMPKLRQKLQRWPGLPVLAQVEQLSETSGSGSVRMLTRAGLLCKHAAFTATCEMDLDSR